MIKSGNALLNIIIEALDQLQERLQGETPAAIDLWNEIKWTQVKDLAKSVLENLSDNDKLKNDLPDLTKLWEGKDKYTWNGIKNCAYLPKEEERLSDYIKNYLQATLKSKGIILHREVEISRKELTDIYVNVSVPNSYGELTEVISVIIEVKGCWNKKDLDNAMNSQLVERYLNKDICKHGLYLVCWFNCKEWDESDYRKNNAPGMTIEEARQKFDLQAAQLSQQGVEVKAYVLNAALS